MKKTLTTLSLLAVAVFSCGISWGYPIPTNWEMKFNNVEFLSLPTIEWDEEGSQVQTFTGLADGLEDNWGVAQITSIIDRSTSTVVWSPGDNGEFLTVMFGGLDINTITGVDLNNDDIPDQFNTQLVAATWADVNGNTIQDAGETVSPFLSVYLDTTLGTAYDITGGPTARTTPYAYPTITDGTKQADFVFASGVVSTNGSVLTDVDSDFITLPLSGDGIGFANVLAGSGPLAAIVDTDGFLTAFGTRDIRFAFDFRPHPDPNLTDYGWDLNSEDPVIGTAVPEPGTLFLLGAGLLGLGVFSRKRAKS